MTLSQYRLRLGATLGLAVAIVSGFCPFVFAAEPHFKTISACVRSTAKENLVVQSAEELRATVVKQKELYKLFSAESLRMGDGYYYDKQYLSPEETAYFRAKAKLGALASNKIVSRWYVNEINLGLSQLRWEIAKTQARAWLTELKAVPPTNDEANAIAHFLFSGSSSARPSPELDAFKPVKSYGLLRPDESVLRELPMPTEHQLDQMAGAGRITASANGTVEEPSFAASCCQAWSGAKQANVLCGFKCPIPPGIRKMAELENPGAPPAPEVPAPHNSLPVWLLYTPPDYPLPSGARPQ